MAFPASRSDLASARSLESQSRMQAATQEHVLDLQRSLQPKLRHRASSLNTGSLNNSRFRAISAPSLQIQTSGNQTLGGNTIGNAQNLGNLSGKVSYQRKDSVGSNNASDFFKVTLSKSSRFKASLNDLTGDANLWLLKSNGKTLSKSTRSGNRSEVVQGNLKAGTYYIQVATNGNSAGYSLNLKGSGRSIDAGNSRTAAIDAGNLSRTQRRYRGQVGGNDVDDFYRFDVSEGGIVKLTASGIGGDVDLQLLNSSGTEVSKSTSTSNANESINQNLAAGSYVLRVSPFSSSKSNYTLDMSSNYTGPANSPIASVTPSPSPSPSTNSPQPSAPGGDPGNTLGSAEVQSSSFSRTQQVNKDDRDFYRFNVGQSGVFKAELSGLSGDADVKLIQDKNNNGAIDQGEVLGWQWEWGTGNESIRRFLQAGNYFVEVMGYGSEMKNYTLKTSFAAQASDDRKFSIQLNYQDGLGGIGSTVKNAIADAAKYWENVIPFSSFNGAHTLNIDVVGIGSSQDWLAAATNTGGQTAANGKWMPTTGTVRINTSYASTFNSNPNYVKTIVAHELAHVLGIGTLWEKNGRNLISGNSYQADSYAGRAYGELNGSLQPTAVPVEASRGHWDEGTFNSELLTPFAESIGSPMPLSQITIASLRDLGWNVNYGAAESYSLTQSIKRPDSIQPDAVATTNAVSLFPVDNGNSTLRAFTSPAGVTQDAASDATRCKCPLCDGMKAAMGLNRVGSLADAMDQSSFSDATTGATASKWTVI